MTPAPLWPLLLPAGDRVRADGQALCAVRHATRYRSLWRLEEEPQHRCDTCEVNRRCMRRWPHEDFSHHPDGNLERAFVAVLTDSAQSGGYHGLEAIACGKPNPRTNVALK